MGSDLHPRRALAVGTGLLALAAFGAGASYQAGAAASTAVTAASGAAALAGLALMRRGWSALPAQAPLPPMELPPSLTQDQRQLAARALALETQLEFAPIALFRQYDAPAELFEPVNANARRLLAPGRASDVAALRGTLSALVAGRRSVIDIDT